MGACNAMQIILMAFSESFLALHRSLRRRRLPNPRCALHRIAIENDHHLTSQSSGGGDHQPYPSPLHDKTLMLDVEGGLLRSSSTFPYFMLVAVEAGSLARGLLLLLLYPLLRCLGRGAALRVMAFVSFVGIKAESFKAGTAVLPKFLMADVGREAFETVKAAAAGGKKVVCVTGMPRVMVEGFLRGYLEVPGKVVAREMRVIGGHYCGLMEEDATVEERLRWTKGEVQVRGFGSESTTQQPIFSQSKEVHLVSEAEKGRQRQALPRDEYPKSLVFHDGRLAFLPSPSATLAMFLWLPFAVLLSIFRSIVFVCLPYRISIPIGAATGMTNRLIARPPVPGKLYVCNHRTLLDPVYISASLNRVVVAATYSVSAVSEAISPIKTVRLTRNKEQDRRKMERLLRRGDNAVVVCPEGTTCREPFLLRFSPLFAELADEVVPVALATRVSMFYGTTATGFKVLDSFYFLANPWPAYDVEFLQKMEMGGGGSRYEVANRVQREIASALGFRCTTLTRKDKYLMLAGNEGVVNTE